jgi:carbon-monoxide dehydrogenase large subunit
MRFAGIVLGKACDTILEEGGSIAARLLEVAPADIEFRGGRFSVKGTDRSVGLFEAAAAGPLAAAHTETVRVAGFPYGCQVCEVEIDPETGVVEIARLAAVDDVGRAINPLILHGQTHGGFAQGAGQALLEECRYDPESGQMLSASFMDYAMPRADHFPEFATELSEVPSPTNPLGVRAGGEGGTTPALAAVANAIADALAELGVRHIELPATPERVWRAIRAARESAPR